MGVNKVIYNGETIMDITGLTVTPETLVKGITAVNAAGDEITGTFTETDPTVPEWAKAETKPSYAASEISGLFDLIYPIGRIIYTTNAANPSEYLGRGTWTQIKDVFLLAAGDTYEAGSTGGEAEHTLTISEMPSHTHDIRGKMSAGTTTAQSFSIASQNCNTDNRYGPYATGGDQPHNNMPPYRSVYVWERIS